jgi:cytoskeletal protein CcmA (bactofilin family)
VKERAVFNKRNEPAKPDSPPSDDGAAPPARPFLRPSLSPGTSVAGRLSFEAPTRIDGSLRGEVRAADLLVIGEKGIVDGVVRAAQLIVYGQIHGEIRGAAHVEIAASAIVSGLVEAHSLVVHEGATFDGDVKIEPPRAATVHVLPLRAAPK